jgi:tRNA A-37 threonylcarbamoyl transferase component Bud32
MSEGLAAQILLTCKRVAGQSAVTAVSLCSDYALGLSVDRETVEVLLVIRDFQPRLMHHLKVFDGHTVAILAVDQWVFERDVDRGFLGEASASGLIFPYDALENAGYLRAEEVKLKKRLITELLENLVVSFPELCHEILIKPEYFMYETMLSRARLFPPTMYGLLSLIEAKDKEKSIRRVLEGYSAALEELQKAGIVHFSDGCVKIAESFVNSSKNRRVRFTNLLKPAQRTLFASLLSVFPRVMAFLSQNKETLVGLQRFMQGSSKPISELAVPEKYLFIPTARGRVPMADKLGIEAYAGKALSAGKNARVAIEEIGGVLNDVYLIRVTSDGEESKVVVKRFKDWSSFKWFPLTLWTVGTRTFAVLARSRLEREIAINQLLCSKGFDVPRILHVSADERLVFMEYVEGENASNVVRRLAASRSPRDTRRDLTVIERIGRKFAKVHALGIALGDTKPENVMIGKHGEIYLMDFEQAARGGDKVWDVAEFLYYAGHDVPPLADVRVVERISEGFIRGYLEAGGKVETVVKAGTAKYTKVFSVFTLPHVMLAMSNACRNAGKLEA